MFGCISGSAFLQSITDEFCTGRCCGLRRSWPLALVLLSLGLCPGVAFARGVVAGSPSVHLSTGAFVTRDAPVILTTAGSDSRLPYLLGSSRTNYFHAIPSQEKNIELVARRLNGTLVEPGQVFSYYRRIGPYTAENGFGWGRMFVGDRIVPSVGGGVCQGSSTLYAAVLRTGLPIVERHHHGLTVPYLPPGEDATVASDYLDFRFLDNRTTPVLITASTKDRHLSVQVWGASPGPQIVVKHEILQEYPFRTVQQFNPQLKPGETRVAAPGQPGVKVKTWLEIKTPEGTETKPLSIDTYRPSPRIVESGTRFQ